ncbi:hypothetical protein NA78x_002313 [Anatilimnocola sp. NA78]|uniref:hypothetical protein n=1 Tax=Anatilimnocola sp. NA78 TaxID=3415683 RepID=UPI003CE47081
MRLSRLRARFSLRLVFLATFVVAAVLQTGLHIRARTRERRREVYVADIRAAVVTARNIGPTFSPRMLDYVERRITAAPDSRLLSPHQQRLLLGIVNAERIRQRLVPELNQLAVGRQRATLRLAATQA